MCNTNIGVFCAEHEDYLELLAAEPYYIKMKEDSPYIIFNYDQIRSDFNNPIVQEARGIIFKKGEWNNPVCWAFNKFGNYGESYVPEIDWNTAFVTEKIDGSLIKVWWDWDGGWHVSTNGTVDAWKAEIGDARMPDFGYYFLEALGKYFNCFSAFVENLDFDYTYMFELVGPYNRVVVPHDEPDLYFLGARNKYTGEEFSCTALEMGSLGVGKFRRPAIFPLHTLEDCVKAAELKTWDDEGFVVSDAKFNRVKIKSPAYVVAHFARNNNVITRKHLIRVILMNEVEEFCCYAADYKEELFKVKSFMDTYRKIGNQLVSACHTIANKISRGDYARLVKALPNIYQGLLFLNYENHVSAEEYTSKWNENKWADYLERLEKLKDEYFA